MTPSENQRFAADRLQLVAKAIRQSRDLGGYIHPDSYEAMTIRRLVEQISEDIGVMERRCDPVVLEAVARVWSGRAA